MDSSNLPHHRRTKHRGQSGEGCSQRKIPEISIGSLVIHSIIAGNTGGCLWRYEETRVAQDDEEDLNAGKLERTCEILWDQGNNVFFVSVNDAQAAGAVLPGFVSGTLRPESLAAGAPFFTLVPLIPAGVKSGS